MPPRYFGRSRVGGVVFARRSRTSRISGGMQGHEGWMFARSPSRTSASGRRYEGGSSRREEDWECWDWGWDWGFGGVVLTPLRGLSAGRTSAVLGQ